MMIRTAIGLVAALAALAVTDVTAEAKEPCGAFEPAVGTAVDMAFKGKTVFDMAELGAAAGYKGPDGTLTYYRFDMGLETISQESLDAATHQSVIDMHTIVEMVNGEVVQTFTADQAYPVGDVTLRSFVVLGRVSGTETVEFLATASDGFCIHKVRYTPNLTGLDAEGRDPDGLVVYERFLRALDALSPYLAAPKGLKPL